MDRIDLHVEVVEVEHENLLASQVSDPSESEPVDDTQKRIANARQIQFERYNSRIKLNADLTNKEIRDKGSLTEDAREMLNQAAKRLDISARSYIKTAKVARTIADLDKSEKIEAGHIAEALSLRPQIVGPM